MAAAAGAVMAAAIEASLGDRPRSASRGTCRINRVALDIARPRAVRARRARVRSIRARRARPLGRDTPIATRAWITLGPPARPLGRATPIATGARRTPTPGRPPSGRAMPTITSTTSIIPAWSTDTGTATTTAAGAEPGMAALGPGAPARQCMVGAIRATTIPTLALLPEGAASHRREMQLSLATHRNSRRRPIITHSRSARPPRRLSSRRHPVDRGLRPGPRRLQGGRLPEGPRARPAGPRPDAQRPQPA